MRPSGIRSRTSAIPRFAAVVALLAVALAACGDDADETATTTTMDSTTTTTAAPTTTNATTTTLPTTTSRPPGAANVAVTVDGQAVPLQRVCRGVDGAVVAIATTGAGSSSSESLGWP